MRKTKPVVRNPSATRARLVEAARQEFEGTGFDLTNTNRIARRAGYAPQTFYRHFTDKTAIFLQAYNDWAAGEMRELVQAGDAETAADILIRHHRSSRRFRRTLRLLSVGDDKVRAARAKNRLEQIATIAATNEVFSNLALPARATTLFTIERVADACAEEEFSDLDVSVSDAKAELARLIAYALGLPPVSAESDDSEFTTMPRVP